MVNLTEMFGKVATYTVNDNYLFFKYIFFDVDSKSTIGFQQSHVVFELATRNY